MERTMNSRQIEAQVDDALSGVHLAYSNKVKEKPPQITTFGQLSDKHNVKFKKSRSRVHLAHSNKVKEKSPQITTFGQLSDKYNVKFDESNYYIPNIERDYRIEKVDCKNLEYVRDYMTFEINKKYFDYCSNNNIKIDHYISMPEHIVNCVEGFIKEYDLEREEFIEIIKGLMDEYVDADGRVYNNTYEKYLKDSINEIKNKQKDGYVGDLLVKEIVNNSKINDNNFKLRNVAIISVDVVLGKYSQKLKACNKEKFQRKLTEAKKGDKHSNQKRRIVSHISRQISIAEAILSCLPKQYLCSPQIYIDDDKCLKKGNSKRYVPHYNTKNILYIPSISDSITIAHEVKHFILHQAWGKPGRTISIAECNLKYEMTKGNPIIKMNNSDNYFKPVNCDGPNKYDEYITKMEHCREAYSPQNEVIPYIFSDYLLKDMQFKNGRVVDVKTNQPVSLKKLMGDNFDKLCKLDIRLGALMLSFFKGEL